MCNESKLEAVLARGDSVETVLLGSAQPQRALWEGVCE